MATESNFPFNQAPVWQPNPDWIAASNLQAFMARHGIASYPELLTRANTDIGWFWDAVMADLDIQFAQFYTTVYDPTPGIEFPRWCVDGEMNIVHNLLDKWQATPVRDQIALRWEGEEGVIRTFTYGQLDAEVCRCANALRGLGLGKGDAIGLYMPMIPELAVAFLAIVKIGGVILPLFSGYGPSAIVARLIDADARAVITADGAWRRGQPVAMKPTLDEALHAVPSVQSVLVVRRIDATETPMTPGRDHWWRDLWLTSQL